jgi:hypothetical protein
MKKTGIFLAPFLVIFFVLSSCTKKEKSVTKTDITFNNPAFTDIYITLDGIDKTVPVGSSVTYYSVKGSSADYYAYTNGATTSGTQLGELVTWENTLTLTGGTDSYNLNVSSTYFFIYITNSGTHTLINLYVNYGLSSQTYDNPLIANNSVKYKIGYYKAYTNSNVRMYYQDQPSSYCYWNQGSHFTLPWTNNQKAELLNNNKSASIGTVDKSNMVPAQFSNISVSNLYPAQSFTYEKDPNAIDLYSK